MTGKDKKILRLAEILEPRDVQTILNQTTIFLGFLILISGVIYLASQEEA